MITNITYNIDDTLVWYTTSVVEGSEDTVGYHILPRLSSHHTPPH